jgi:hypothetical protein
MDIAKAMADLGVRTDLLDEETIRRLDEDGFARLPFRLAAGQVEAFRSRLAELAAAEGDRAGAEVAKEPGADRLSNLVDKDPLFDVCFTHPVLLAAVQRVLGDFKLSSVSSRAALPGQGHQHLHSDFKGGPFAEGDYQDCNSIWLLDDFTESNGATRIVPGTHRDGRLPAQCLTDPFAPHPHEQLLLGPAGTVFVFNGHVWHGGTRNRTDRPRRSLNAYFTRRHNPQQVVQARFLRPETLDRLSPAARFVLDA